MTPAQQLMMLSNEGNDPTASVLSFNTRREYQEWLASKNVGQRDDRPERE